jgi:hypothetical protein
MPPQLGLVATGVYQCHVDRFRYVLLGRLSPALPGLPISRGQQAREVHESYGAGT